MDLRNLKGQNLEDLVRDKTQTFQIKDMEDLKVWDRADWTILSVDREDNFSDFARSGLKNAYHIPWLRKFDAYADSLNETPVQDLPPEKDRLQQADILRTRAGQFFLKEFQFSFGHEKKLKIIIASTIYQRVVGVIKALLKGRHRMDIKLAVFVMSPTPDPSERSFINTRSQPHQRSRRRIENLHTSTNK